LRGGETLEVNTSIPVSFEVVENIEDSRFLKAKVWICHTGLNLNNSDFSKPVIEDAIPSLANTPILGFIEVNSLNEADFRGHEQRIVIEKDGISIEYIGRAYGVVSETNNAKFEFKICEDGVEREFLTAEVLLWKKFSDCIEIFEKGGIKGQSMELEPSSIEGKFNKQKVFQFSKFKFEGLCILGDGITPAMRGSVIEKFSTYTTQDSFKDMLDDFNLSFSKYSTMLDEQENEPEGGNKVNEKLELIASFSTLIEEDVAELKAIADQYTLEELEVKLNEIVASKEVPNVETEVTAEFSITSRQLEQEIRTELSKERYVNSWGDTSRSYWYIDHDDERIYAEDAQFNDATIGINYSKNGDFIVIDFSTKKRIKFVPVDMEGTDVISPSFISVERSEFETTSAKEINNKEMEDKFQLIETELNEIKPRFELASVEIDSLKAELASDVNPDFDLAKAEIEKLKDENSILVSFKTEKEKEEKMNIFSQFSDLDESDISPLMEAIDTLTSIEIEEKLFAIKGRKNISFSAKEKKQPNLVFALSDFKETKPDQPTWLDLVTEYKNKI